MDKRFEKGATIDLLPDGTGRRTTVDGTVDANAACDCGCRPGEGDGT